MTFSVKCYNNDKIVYRADVTMTRASLIHQLKDRILFYDTVNGETEFLMLDNFDRVKISVPLFGELISSYYVDSKEDEENDD